MHIFHCYSAMKLVVADLKYQAGLNPVKVRQRFRVETAGCPFMPPHAAKIGVMIPSKWLLTEQANTMEGFRVPPSSLLAGSG